MRVGRFRYSAVLAAAMPRCACVAFIVFTQIVFAQTAFAQTPARVPSRTAGTAVKESAAKSPPPGTASHKSVPVLGDEALARAIAQRFAKSAIRSNGFSVSVSGGIATLRGTTQVPQHKGVATRLARAAGAKQVRNQIELSPSARESMQRLRKSKAAQPQTQSTTPGARPSAAPRPENDANRSGNAKEFASIPPAAASNGTAQPVKKFSIEPPSLGNDRAGSAQRRERQRRY